MLGTALFADSVINLLNNIGPSSFTGKKETVEKVKRFVNDIKAGNRIISSGKLEKRAIESVDAFEMSLAFLTYNSKDETYGDLFDNLAKELEYVSNSDHINLKKVKHLLGLFKAIRSEALENVQTPA